MNIGEEPNLGDAKICKIQLNRVFEKHRTNKVVRLTIACMEKIVRNTMISIQGKAKTAKRRNAVLGYTRMSSMRRMLENRDVP